MEKIVYRGWIKNRDYGDSSYVLFLDDPAVERGPMAEVISDNIDEYGRYLSVRYYISDTEIPEDKLDEALMESLHGKGDAVWDVVYSEITGHLWTDEEITVGGHDLLDELQDNEGKFCHLEIGYSKTEKGE